MKTSTKFLASVVALVAAQSTWAQSAGTWMARVGATTITPEVSGGVLNAPSLPNSRTDVREDTQVSGGVTYMYTDNLSVDIHIAPPFKHKLYGAGALAGVGQVGSVEALPISVFLQYRFMEASSAFRPYVGLGATYAYFSNAKGSAVLTAVTNPGGPSTSITVDSQFTLTPQIGLTYAFNDKYFVDLVYTKSMLKTTTKLSTGQSADINLDPYSVSLTFGLRF
jgi:outer membrane protein